MAIPTGSTHYKDGSIEPLELIEAQRMSFHLGNVVKYAVRAEHHSKRKRTHTQAVEAVEKAIWYLQRYREEVLNAKSPSTP